MARLVNMELGFLSFEKTDNLLSKLSSELCIPHYVKYECLENFKSDSEKLMIAVEEISSLEKKLNGVVGIARLLLKEISRERSNNKREVCSENALLQNSNENLIKKTSEIATQTEEENNNANKDEEEKMILDIVDLDNNEKNNMIEKIARKKEKIARLKEEIGKINQRNEQNAMEFSEVVLRLADLEGKKYLDLLIIERSKYRNFESNI